MIFNQDRWKRKIALGLLHSEDGGDGGGGGSNGDGGDGGAQGDTNFHDGFPESVQGWDEVKNSKGDGEKFWKQMGDMRSRMGQSIRIPGKDAGDEDWDTFNQKLQNQVPTLMQTPDFDNSDTLGELYGKMGRPETAEDYTNPEIKNEDGQIVELDENRIKAMAPILHSAGLTQKQFDQIVSTVALNDSITAGKQAEVVGADQAKLVEEWGAAHQKNSEIVTNFAKKFGAPEGLQKGISDGRVNSETMMWLHSLATKSLGQVSDFQGDVGGKDGVLTPSEAEAQLSEIMNNTKHSYWNKMEPGHKEAVAKVRKLHLLKNPVDGSKPAPGTQF